MKKLIFTGILIAFLVGLCGCASDSRADGAMHPFMQIAGIYVPDKS